MLPIEDMKKEPPESPCSPKALDFKLFSQSDNGIYLYQFLVLHFRIYVNKFPIRVLIHKIRVMISLQLIGTGLARIIG